MDYRKMIENARNAGVADEQKMWESIDAIGDIVSRIKEEHPELYWKFIRRQHGILCDGHYDEMFAEHDVSRTCYTDGQGREHHGAHWTVDQIENAVDAFEFPDDVSRWDKYVAFNAAYADFGKHFTEEQVIQIGYDFFFADEDWNGGSKIWDYMCISHD